jgi:hypothetical protein
MPPIGQIKKEVGQVKPESPLKQAFRLKEMLERLLGKTKWSSPPDENVRRIIGRP